MENQLIWLETQEAHSYITLQETCSLTEAFPDIETIMSHHHTIEVVKKTTLKATEIVEQQIVEGQKVLVAGLLEVGIVYAALREDQTVHFFPCNLPFQTFVHDNTDSSAKLFDKAFSLTTHVVDIHLEHLNVCQVDKRMIEIEAVLKVCMQPCNPNNFDMEGPLEEEPPLPLKKDKDIDLLALDRNQLIANETYWLPKHMPDMKRIAHVNVVAHVKKTRPIPARGKRYHGQNGGLKVLVTGELTIEVEYAANAKNNPVHYAFYELPFISLLKGGRQNEVIYSDFIEEVVIDVEHMQTHLLTPRSLQIVVILKVQLKTKETWEE